MLDSTLKRRGGWRRRPFSTNELRGAFLVPADGKRTLRVHGRLVRSWDGTIAVYVEDPPRRGRYQHEHCLQWVTGTWFKLHFECPPRSFESAIFFTEHYLLCCLLGGEVG